MPSSVKITDLPAISSVQRGDIIPVVDESQTQTNKATLGQVKDMECGANSVVETSIADAAVTKQKTGYTANDKMFVATSSHPQSQVSGNTPSTANADGKFDGREITISPYIQALMQQADGPAARNYLDSLQSTHDATFTGQTRFPKTALTTTSDEPEQNLGDTTSTNLTGSEIYPALVSQATNVGAGGVRTTGIYWPADDPQLGDRHEVGVACFGQRIWLAGPLGIKTIAHGFTSLHPSYGVRAYAVCSTTAATRQVLPSPHYVTSYVGLGGGSIWADPNGYSIAQVRAMVTAANSNQSILATQAAYYTTVRDNAAYGWSQQHHDGRRNYTTPHDNWHWYYQNGAWTTVGATGRNWIGSAAVETAGNCGLEHSGNIMSIENITGNQYRFTFIDQMPTIDYGVIIGVQGTASNSITHGGILAKTQTTFDIILSGGSDPTTVAVIL